MKIKNTEVIYFDNESGDKRVLANGFKDFIDGLSIKDEVDEILRLRDEFKTLRNETFGGK